MGVEWTAQIYFVASGAVGVTMHSTQWVLGPDSVFMVPPGTAYELRNFLPQSSARLYFTTIKDTLPQSEPVTFRV